MFLHDSQKIVEGDIAIGVECDIDLFRREILRRECSSELIKARRLTLEPQGSSDGLLRRGATSERKYRHCN